MQCNVNPVFCLSTGIFSPTTHNESYWYLYYMYLISTGVVFEYFDQMPSKWKINPWGKMEFWPVWKTFLVRDSKHGVMRPVLFRTSFHSCQEQRVARRRDDGGKNFGAEMEDTNYHGPQKDVREGCFVSVCAMSWGWHEIGCNEINCWMHHNNTSFCGPCKLRHTRQLHSSDFFVVKSRPRASHGTEVTGGEPIVVDVFFPFSVRHLTRWHNVSETNLRSQDLVSLSI